MANGLDKKQIAKKLNTSVGNVNQLILKNKAKKGRDFTVDKRVNHYTPAYVKMLEKNRGTPRAKRKAIKSTVKQGSKPTVMSKPITGSSTIQVSVDIPKSLSLAYTAEFLEKRIQAMVNKSIEPQLKKLIDAIQD